MDKVLVVEDSKSLASMLERQITTRLNFQVHVAHSYAQGVKLIDSMADRFFVALLDLNLPDAKSGEIVDYARSKNIPSIVFTGEADEKIRKKILSKRVVDYVLKNTAHSLSQVTYLVGRLYDNRRVKILVVDDSKSSREYIAGMLELHLYIVKRAENGKNALKILEEHPDIMLVITDYNMPGMDGFQLTKKIRKKFPNREDIAIVGISSYGNHTLSAMFLKNGANDFINKPFFIEEFFCRVTQNIETIENMRKFKNASSIDFLTGLFSRSYLFDAGRSLFTGVKSGQMSITLAILEVDQFKKFNLENGINNGDLVLKNIAIVLKDQFMEVSDIVVRLGGKEFALLVTNLTRDYAFEIFDKVQKEINNNPFSLYSGRRVHLKIHLGVYQGEADSFDELVEKAYLALEMAKKEKHEEPYLIP